MTETATQRMLAQRTLAKTFTLSGAGLHTGEPCRVVAGPAAANMGVAFRRADIENRDNLVLAAPGSIIRTRHGACIANQAGVSVATVEHLLSALAIAGVDNAVVDVFGPEIPILDGSAAPFIAAIDQAGLAAQNAPRRIAQIKERVEIADGDRFVRFEPGPGRRVDVEVDFGDCLIGRQAVFVDLDSPEDLVRLCAARTFVQHKEIEALRAAGLIRGGTLANAIVVDGQRILNDEPLRDASEFALHKALDLVGDLYLAGVFFSGRVLAFKPGHDINARAAARLAEMAAEETETARAIA